MVCTWSVGKVFRAQCPSSQGQQAPKGETTHVLTPSVLSKIFEHRAGYRTIIDVREYALKFDMLQTLPTFCSLAPHLPNGWLRIVFGLTSCVYSPEALQHCLHDEVGCALLLPCCNNNIVKTQHDFAGACIRCPESTC